MAWWPYLYGGFEALNELHEERRQLHEDRVNWQIKHIKNPPSLLGISANVLELALIATVHEEQVLNQMKKHYYNIIENYDTETSISLFWKNQEKFLEFIDIREPWKLVEPECPGYRYSHAWFLSRNEKYQNEFKDITEIELQEVRKDFWSQYNSLIKEIHKMAPKHESIDEILIPSIEENSN